MLPENIVLIMIPKTQKTSNNDFYGKKLFQKHIITGNQQKNKNLSTRKIVTESKIIK